MFSLMEDDLLEIIEEQITNNYSFDEIKEELKGKGYLESDINTAINSVADSIHKAKGVLKSRNSKLFTTKEVLDKIGYGFASHQFINILFYFSGASLFLVGLINGLRAVLSVLISSFLQEYSKLQYISKKFIGWAGVVFGFSFLFMAYSIVFRSVPIFALALIIGSFGVIYYGDLYAKLLRESLRKERMGPFLMRIAQYGVLITAVTLLLSAYFIDAIPPDTGRVFAVNLFGTVKTLRAFGYLISFEITAFAFIFSGYVLSKIKQDSDAYKYPLFKFVGEYWNQIRNQLTVFFKNKYILLMLLASVIAGAAEILGNSYYGIFIWKTFKSVGAGPFMNVAIIFAVATVVSLFGPYITRKVNKHIGLAPMLVFGTLLIAMMPLAAAYNPHLFSLGLANSLSIIGSAIVGAAQGLLAHKLLSGKERKLYFASLSMMVIIPFVVLIPVGAFFANFFGMRFIFQVIAFSLVFVVAPLYFILVTLANKRRL
jgi:MFS family permease